MFYKNKNKLLNTNFLTFIIHKPSLGSREIPQKILSPIGLAVLTFIAYKQTDRQAKFIGKEFCSNFENLGFIL